MNTHQYKSIEKKEWRFGRYAEIKSEDATSTFVSLFTFALTFSPSLLPYPYLSQPHPLHYSYSNSLPFFHSRSFSIPSSVEQNVLLNENKVLH